MLIEAVIKWYAEKWAKDNLTESNIKKGFEAVCEWLCDQNIRQALLTLLTFCLKGILQEIKDRTK